MVTLVKPVPVEDNASTESVALRDVERSLMGSGFGQLRDVNCEYHGQVIVLRGQVDSFYLKQLAQELAKKAAPQFQIANLVAVS